MWAGKCWEECCARKPTENVLIFLHYFILVSCPSYTLECSDETLAPFNFVACHHRPLHLLLLRALWSIITHRSYSFTLKLQTPPLQNFSQFITCCKSGIKTSKLYLPNAEQKVLKRYIYVVSKVKAKIGLENAMQLWWKALGQFCFNACKVLNSL